MPDNRARYIATAIQVILLGAVTYYGVKWLVDVLDPTKKSRLAAQKQVSVRTSNQTKSFRLKTKLNFQTEVILPSRKTRCINKELL